ncbi:hypothetical protein J6TS1_12190 [Siminovitchia terrae]|uniref:Uncharacterized protein n=1 Tax=Siminovitchia terrae TaxID=1914933 RepID=A0ABQ4KUN4_SIMTE|nr:hypothetical protein J22TS1_03360 [Siminovitchia terrae]GIN95349.1 hypothetical protein J6TS1_12190 [Siminovitchia terrae]
MIQVEDRLDEHQSIFNVVSDEMKTMKADISYLGGKVGIHDMKLNTLFKMNS